VALTLTLAEALSVAGELLMAGAQQLKGKV
jgi:hypothetical protein